MEKLYELHYVWDVYEQDYYRYADGGRAIAFRLTDPLNEVIKGNVVVWA